jgi:hypothetical protein
MTRLGAARERRCGRNHCKYAPPVSAIMITPPRIICHILGPGLCRARPKSPGPDLLDAGIASSATSRGGGTLLDWTGAMNRYPFPVTVWTKRGCSGLSSKTWRTFRMAALMLLSVSTKTPSPQIRSTICSRVTSWPLCSSSNRSKFVSKPDQILRNLATGAHMAHPTTIVRHSTPTWAREGTNGFSVTCD